MDRPMPRLPPVTSAVRPASCACDMAHVASAEDALAQVTTLGHIPLMRCRWVNTVVLAATLCACSGSELGASVTAIYRVPASLDELAAETWLDHPWPSDVRLEAGSPVFRGFYNPLQVKLIEEYVGVAEGLLDGFSPVAGGYLRFSGAIDAATLPQDPAASLLSESSVFLLNVDSDSPDFGSRLPIEVSFRAPAGTYTLPNTLRWIPSPGFPMRPATTYALVVAHTVRSADDGDVLASDELKQVTGDVPATGARIGVAGDVAPAIVAIGADGTRPREIRHLGVFTTADPTKDATAVVDHLRRAVAPPDFLPDRQPWQRISHGADFMEYRGQYGPLPNYQRGTLPFFKSGDGGEFNFVDGEPEVVDYFDARFSISVPLCDMPPDGYPIVLYAHGTGGDYRSFINSAYPKTLGEKCIAMMGVDQIFHGTRPGTPPTLTEVQVVFFNFLNVVAARTNAAQSAIDEVQRARLFTETGASIPASASHTGEEIRFDPNKVMFFGHSQGGTTGPLYLALDDSARGAVLSGSGSIIMITLLEKTQPQPSIAQLVATVFLALSPEEQEELDIFHPALMVAQSLVDVIDPINYARKTVLEPRPGFAPKSVLLTEGIAPDGTGDSFTPPRGIEAQAVAMGLPLMLPAQSEYAQLGFGAAPAVEVPAGGLSGNLAGGMASGVLAQWAPGEGDGHFVVFDIPRARAQVAEFFRRLADNPVGGVPAP